MIIQRKDFSIEAICRYAESQNVMPYIVIGRLQKEKYLDYMNFGTKEDMFDLSINKYCVEGSEQYEYFKAESAVLKAKPIYPKFKLDHFMSSMNYH